MNYRHLFHAGNFADVLKHVTLMLLLRAFQKKDTPIFYLDTHAGAGHYDLTSAAAQRSAEYHDGIMRLWNAQGLPPALADYVARVRGFNGSDELTTYPGSPVIARQLLREQDRMTLCERHPQEYATLRSLFASDPQVTVHERDGYQAMKALLPPPQRRGLVLMDPPFEQPTEFADIAKALHVAAQRWATGVYAIWYPIKDRNAVARFHRALQTSAWKKVLLVELTLFAEDTAFRLNGCGLIVINPPWGLETELKELLAPLHSLLAVQGQGRHEVTWIANSEKQDN